MHWTRFSRESEVILPCILTFISSLAQQQVKSLETEISGYKRSIQKEEEKNETLTVMLNKAESDKTVTKKKIKISQTKQDALKQQYATYSRTLHETEQSYNKATTVNKQIKESGVKVVLRL